jgi:DNA-binding response OmpR family regulator
LEEEGHSLVTVHNCKDACVLLAHSPADFVIINLALTNADALQYVEKILDFDCDLMILGHADKSARDDNFRSLDVAKALVSSDSIDPQSSDCPWP